MTAAGARVGVWVVTPFVDERELSCQEVWCRSYAAVRGWDVIRVYRDGCAPLWTTNVPALRLLLDDLHDGQFEGIVVSEPELLPRHPKVRSELDAATSTTGRFLVFANCLGHFTGIEPGEGERCAFTLSLRTSGRARVVRKSGDAGHCRVASAERCSAGSTGRPRNGVLPNGC